MVLVVAADDGVMPQTQESITHAKVAETPVVVAINKTDRPDANAQKVRQELTAHGLQSDDWGGDTVMCDVSAITGDGIDHLLEMIALTAEMSELTANPHAPARGRVIEGRKDPSRGVITTLLVEEGTLKRGDTVVAGMGMGRIRTMCDEHGTTVAAALPSRPVEVFGLSDVPDAGDQFYVVKNLKAAKAVIADRKARLQERSAPARPQVTLATLFGEDSDVEVQELRLIVKADVRGSLEPLRTEIEKLSHPEIKVTTAKAAALAAY